MRAPSGRVWGQKGGRGRCRIHYLGLRACRPLGRAAFKRLGARTVAGVPTERGGAPSHGSWRVGLEACQGAKGFAAQRGLRLGRGRRVACRPFQPACRPCGTAVPEPQRRIACVAETLIAPGAACGCDSPEPPQIPGSGCLAALLSSTAFAAPPTFFPPCLGLSSPVGIISPSRRLKFAASFTRPRYILPARQRWNEAKKGPEILGPRGKGEP